MGSDGHTLGSDENSIGKEAHLLGILLILGIFMFFTSNATQAVQNLSKFYLLFAIVPLIAVVYDMLARRSGKSSIIDTITIEKDSPVLGELGKYWKALIIFGSLGFGGFMLLGAGGQSSLQLVSAPTFQLLEPGAAGSALASGIAGLPENLFFFAFLLPTSYLLMRRTDLNRYVAAILAILLIAFLFTIYHWGVYSESPTALDKVFFFGLLCGSLTVVTGNIIPAHAIHFFNNFSVTFFRQTSTDITMWILLYWIVLAFLAWAYLKRGD